jgi:hypothetical protein
MGVGEVQGGKGGQKLHVLWQKITKKLCCAVGNSGYVQT